jgi:hypothetical protein
LQQHCIAAPKTKQTNKQTKLHSQALAIHPSSQPASQPAVSVSMHAFVWQTFL